MSNDSMSIVKTSLYKGNVHNVQRCNLTICFLAGVPVLSPVPLAVTGRAETYYSDVNFKGVIQDVQVRIGELIKGLVHLGKIIIIVTGLIRIVVNNKLCPPN